MKTVYHLPYIIYVIWKVNYCLREIFSFCFDRLIDPLTLPIHPVSEWIILWLLNKFAYLFAYKRVGDLYHSGAIYGSFMGSLFHWMIRFLAFVAIWWITNVMIHVYQFVAAYWLAILMCVGGGMMTMTIGVVCYYFGYKKLNLQNQTVEREK